jgi:hypothetical protein
MEHRTGPDIKATPPLSTGGKVELWVVCKANPQAYQIAYDTLVYNPNI